MNSYNRLVRHDGNKDLFKAVEMSITALANGTPFHVHAQGLRGTGKTSIMRSVKEILPSILRIKGCIYNCHPDRPHCPDHRNLSAEEIAAIGTEKIPCPFLEISHAAKIGTVVGSIDLEKLTNKANPVAALLPGTIPKAHRGIIFIDEINRLADTSPEIADVLLDLMGTKPGWVQIEETGVSTVELSVEVTVWAASNPDEDPGPLTQIRKQLADRFDLVVNMGRPNEYGSVTQILKQRNISFSNVKSTFQVCGNLNNIVYSDAIRNIFSAIYVDFGLESLRAVESMETAAGITALMAGRNSIAVSDISSVVPLVLNHRADTSTITNILKYLDNLNSPMPAAENLMEYTNIQVDKKQIADEKTDSREQWWKRIWTGIREKLSIRSANSNSSGEKNRSNAGPNQNEKKRIKTQNYQKQDDSGNLSTANGGAGANIADPSMTSIIDPPHKAVPLSNLAIDQFVTSEDKKSHG